MDKEQKRHAIQREISWRLIFSLLFFNNKTLEHSKFVKNGLGFILWVDVLGIVLFIIQMYLNIKSLLNF